MSIAAAIGDNKVATVSQGTGPHGKEASEPSGEGSQQRFADVLPLAQAALEKSPEKSPADRVPGQGGATDAKAGADSPMQSARATHRRREGGKNATADPQVPVWPFAGVVQPTVPRQVRMEPAEAQPAKATKAQQAAEPVLSGRGPRAPERASMPVPSVHGAIDARTTAARGQQMQQAEPARGEQPASARVAANVVPSVATPKEKETAPPAPTAGKQAPAVPQTPREATVLPIPQAVKTAAGSVRADHADNPKERTEASPGVRVANPASQVSKQEMPASAKPAPGGGPANIGEKAEHTSVESRPEKGQAVLPQPAGRPEAPSNPGKDLPGQAPPAEGRQEAASKPSASVRREDAKVKVVQTDAKDIPSPAPKEAGAAMSEPRVLPTGDAAAPVQRAAVQTQNQASVDAPPARSPVQSVGEQILDSLHAAATRGDRQVLVRLNPPELGTVLVRFQEQGDHLSGTLEVASREVRREVEQALPQVVRALQEAGVQIRRVEVVTSDQPERNLGGEHQSQDAWQQHQGAGYGRERSQGAPQVRWSQTAGGHNATRQGILDDETRTAAGPGRIDVLL